MTTFDFSTTGLGSGTGGGFTFGSTFGTPSTTSTTTGGGLFGGATGTTPAATGTTPSLFGGTTAGTSNPTAGFSLFGATTPSAGTAAAGTGAGSTSTTPSTGGGSLFGSSFSFDTGTAGASSSLWGSTAAPSSATPSAGADGVRGQPQEAIRAYGTCWSKDSVSCRFIHAFYNLVPPGDVPKYARPQNVDERSWAQAIQQNPDPQRMVPVFAKCFEDLKRRVDEQDANIKEHQTALQDINKIINAINHKHQAGTIAKMEAYKRRNMELASRVLRVMKKIETLRALGIPSVPEEEAFRDKLQKLRRELNQPTTFKPKLNELISHLLMQDEMQDLNYEGLDEENMAKIFQVLQQQQEGLMRLTEILTQDLQDIQLMLANTTSISSS